MKKSDQNLWEGSDILQRRSQEQQDFREVRVVIEGDGVGIGTIAAWSRAGVRQSGTITHGRNAVRRYVSADQNASLSSGCIDRPPAASVGHPVSEYTFGMLTESKVVNFTAGHPAIDTS